MQHCFGLVAAFFFCLHRPLTALSHDWMFPVCNACRQLWMLLFHTVCWDLAPRAFTGTLWKSNTSTVLRKVPAQQVGKSVSGTAISTESKQRWSHSCVHTVCPTSAKLDHPPRGTVTSKGKGVVESYLPWGSLNSIWDDLSGTQKLTQISSRIKQDFIIYWFPCIHPWTL